MTVQGLDVLAGAADPAWQALAARAEDAGLNASAAPQQRWVDGWMVRFNPGKAKRARCIQPVADGRLPLAERLALCAEVYARSGLPMVARLTPFSCPAGLDAALATMGWSREDDTRVMLLPQLAEATPVCWPTGLHAERVDHEAYAHIVGGLRGSPGVQCAAHAERLQHSPVPYQGWVLRRLDNGEVLACGQVAVESTLAGLYDVFTAPAARGHGLARQLCTFLLQQARVEGARSAYLQVDADNEAARRVYHRMGFADAYAYHYRVRR